MAQISAYFTTDEQDVDAAHQRAKTLLQENSILNGRTTLNEEVGLERTNDNDERPQYSCRIVTEGWVNLDILVQLGFDFEAGLEG